MKIDSQARGKPCFERYGRSLFRPVSLLSRKSNVENRGAPIVNFVSALMMITLTVNGPQHQARGQAFMGLSTTVRRSRNPDSG